MSNRSVVVLVSAFLLTGLLPNVQAADGQPPIIAGYSRSFSLKAPVETAQKALDLAKSVQGNDADFLDKHTNIKKDFEMLESSAQAMVDADWNSQSMSTLEGLISKFSKALDATVKIVGSVEGRSYETAAAKDKGREITAQLAKFKDGFYELTTATQDNEPAEGKSAEPAEPASSGGGTAGGRSLSRNFLNSVVIIEGDLGAGSGFIAKMHDQFFIVTNQHVLSGNTKFTVTGIDGTKYPTDGPLFGAVGYDVAILRIPTAVNFVTIEDNSDADAQVNDPVVVLGNAEGGGVATQVTGKLLGIGPAQVEVDAKFVHGNSGSPIIDSATGKVIGIATYVRQVPPDALQKAANAPQLHWFGYRLDTIKQWEQLDWQRFSREGEQLAKAEALTDSFIDFAQQIRTKAVNSIHAKNPQIDDVFTSFVREAQNAAKVGNQHDLVTAQVRFMSDLTAVLNDDVNALADQKLYSYHAAELKNLAEIRKAIKQPLQDAINRLEDASRGISP